MTFCPRYVAADISVDPCETPIIKYQSNAPLPFLCLVVTYVSFIFPYFPRSLRIYHFLSPNIQSFFSFIRFILCYVVFVPSPPSPTILRGTFSFFFILFSYNKIAPHEIVAEVERTGEEIRKRTKLAWEKLFPSTRHGTHLRSRFRLPGKRIFLSFCLESRVAVGQFPTLDFSSFPSPYVILFFIGFFLLPSIVSLPNLSFYFCLAQYVFTVLFFFLFSSFSVLCYIRCYLCLSSSRDLNMI